MCVCLCVRVSMRVCVCVCSIGFHRLFTRDCIWSEYLQVLARGERQIEPERKEKDPGRLTRAHVRTATYIRMPSPALKYRKAAIQK